MSNLDATARARAAQWGLGRYADPAQRVLGTAIGTAGQSGFARYAPGELARRTGLTEDEVHDALVQLVEQFKIEACSHPQYIVLPVPEYVPPAPEPTALPGNLRAVTRYRKDGRPYTAFVRTTDGAS